MRSAKAPVISAGVMIANLSWNRANRSSGIVAASAGCVAPPTPRNMKKVSGLPTRPWMLSPKARLNPTTIQRIVMIPMATKLWNIVEMTFLVRTIPP